MGKTLKYVSEFSFPSDKGYSGSAGQQMVKGYARGGSCGPMKKADGGAVDDPRRPMIDRTVGEYINPVNRERAMERAMKLEERQRLFGGPLTADGGAVDDPRRPMMDRTVGEYIDVINRERAMERAMKLERAKKMFPGALTEAELSAILGGGPISNAERMAMEQRAPRRISQGLRSPTAEMARERAIMGEDAGYKKGGMAMRKQYPTNNGKPMISGPKAAPAPKADMLYSKKENSAKNLLADGKAPNLPSAKGGVNMAKGGSAKVGKVMREFKAGELHSGSKSGPVVKSRKQAIAIGLSEARKGKK